MTLATILNERKNNQKRTGQTLRNLRNPFLRSFSDLSVFGLAILPWESPSPRGVFESPLPRGVFESP